MDIYQALYTTRAMRRLKPDPIPLDVQARILDAAIHAPTIQEDWRFLLVDDPAIKSQLAPLYLQAFERMVGGPLDQVFGPMLTSDTPMGRAVRSGVHLARHFGDVPLLLIGFGRSPGGGGVYPALWSAMLAARAEGVGSTLTAMLQTFYENEACEILGVPKDEGWRMHGIVAMGYPLGKWGVGARKPIQEVAARNRWNGELGLNVSEPLWHENSTPNA